MAGDSESKSRDEWGEPWATKDILHQFEIWDNYILQFETNMFSNLRQIHFTICEKYIFQFDTNIFCNLRQIYFAEMSAEIPEPPKMDTFFIMDMMRSFLILDHHFCNPKSDLVKKVCFKILIWIVDIRIQRKHINIHHILIIGYSCCCIVVVS